MIPDSAVASIPADGGKAYRDLIQIVRDRGWDRKVPGRILGELALHLALHLGGMAVFIFADNLFVRAAAMLVSIYGGLGIATNTHTSSHYATSQSRTLNKALTYFGYTFLFGTSANYWWNKHCVVHHPAPNVIGIDVDADLMPFFAVNDREVAQSRGFARFFYRIQWMIIPFAIGMNTFFTQYQGWRFLLPILFDSKRRRTSHWLDLGILLLHYVTFFAIPMLFFPPLHVLGFYLIRSALMGYAMFIGFAPAHYPLDAAFVDKSQLADDYLLRQTATTVNFRTGFFGRLACAGVEYQIEHHLFPFVPHTRYPEMSSFVEEYCRQHGYPYRTLGWWEGTWKSLVLFYKPKKVFDDIEAFRAPSEVKA